MLKNTHLDEIVPQEKDINTENVSSEELVKLRNENARLKEALKDSQEFIDTVADAAYEIFWRTDEKH